MRAPRKPGGRAHGTIDEPRKGETLLEAQRLLRLGQCSVMIRAIYNVLVDEQGQGLAEYGLILGLIAVLCIVAVTFLSGSIQGILSNIGSSI